MRRSLLLLPLIIGLFPVTGFAATAGSTGFPRDFRVIRSERGVTMLRRGRDYMQVITPSQGGRMRLLAGKVMDWSANLTLERQSMDTWWEQVEQEVRRPISIVNGQFFDMSTGDRAALAFSVKIDGRIISGYGDMKEYIGKKRMLLIGERGGDIVAYADDPDSLLQYEEQNIIVGLDPIKAGKTAKSRRGRTFIGTDDNGTIYLYSSPATTQRLATAILMRFGVSRDKILMLDGGGSTYLLQNGRQLLPTARGGAEPPARSVPQIIAVEAIETVSAR